MGAPSPLCCKTTRVILVQCLTLFKITHWLPTACRIVQNMQPVFTIPNPTPLIQSKNTNFILIPWRIMFLPMSILSHMPSHFWRKHLPNTCFRFSLAIVPFGRHPWPTKCSPSCCLGPQTSLIIALKVCCNCPVICPVRNKLYNELASLLCIWNKTGETPSWGNWENSHSNHLLCFVVQMKSPVEKDYQFCESRDFYLFSSFFLLFA